MWARLLTGRSSECLSNRLTGVKQFTLGKKLRFRAPGASGRTQTWLPLGQRGRGNPPDNQHRQPRRRRQHAGPKKCARRAAKAASRASSSPTRWSRRFFTSSRAKPTTSTAVASTPTLWDSSLPPAEAARSAGRTAGLGMHRSQFDVTAAIGSRVSGPPLLRHA
jgi:hypothetical protein